VSEACFCIRCGHALAPHHDGERERLRCTDAACGFTHYGNPTPVVAAIVEHVRPGDREGAIVLIRQHGWPEKHFGLVTGFLEANEEPHDGAIREVREELGLTAELVGIVGAYAFPHRNEVIIAFHVRAEGEIVHGAEILAHRHVAPEKLRPWPFGTGHAVRDWLDRRAR
jgi:NAD+ diphosphatase